MQLEVLNTLHANDVERRNHCVHLREWFEYRHHVCMVFEKLGLSLYDFLRKNSYKPFHVDMVSPGQLPAAESFEEGLLDAARASRLAQSLA